jgi:endonuclease YncB( thermonuclease family)
MRYIIIFLILISNAMAIDIIEVIDGDTIKYNGQSIRIIGCDTFETHKNKQAYRQANRYLGGDINKVLELGKKAKVYAEKYFYNMDLININYIGTGKYDRTLGIVTKDEKDYCEDIIEAGLARNYCGAEKDAGWYKRNKMTKDEWKCKE